MKTEKGITKCAEWLVYCLDVGFKKEDLNALEKLFWRFRDKNGNPKKFKQLTHDTKPKL